MKIFLLPFRPLVNQSRFGVALIKHWLIKYSFTWPLLVENLKSVPENPALLGLEVESVIALVNASDNVHFLE